MNIVHKFQQGLKKSSAYLTNNLINILKQNKINDESIETIESVLISADISLDVTTQLVDKIRFFSNKLVVLNYILFLIFATHLKRLGYQHY